MYLAKPILTSYSPPATTGAVEEEGYWRSFARFGLMSFIFGFYDNFIMVTAGEGIESMFGPALRRVVADPETQTFAAAGLGNTVSDAFGVGVADRVVGGLAKIGGPVFGILEPKGIANPDGAFWGNLLGITGGCLAGLGTALAARWAGYIGSAVGIPAVLLYASTLPQQPQQMA